MNSIDIHNTIMSQLKVESEWINNNQDIERVSSLIKQILMQIDTLNNLLQACCHPFFCIFQFVSPYQFP